MTALSLSLLYPAICMVMSQHACPPALGQAPLHGLCGDAWDAFHWGKTVWGRADDRASAELSAPPSETSAASLMTER
jgi:hypothetical protein